MKKIKKTSEKLRNGEEIYVNLRASGVFLAHDDVLLPHWSELSDAIQLGGEGDLVKVIIHGIQLNQSVIEMFSQSLVSKCGAIDLANNDFMNQDGVNFAVEVMRNNPRMKAFGFGNAIQNEEIADQLCRSIMIHPHIHSLSLSRCCNEGDTFGYTMLKTLLSSSTSKSFVKLYLMRSHIRTNGCSILPDYIATNTPLTDLALNGNHLVDDDLRMISIALKTNDRLKELYLRRNDYTSIGIKWLEVAVRGLRPIRTASGNNFLDPSFDSVFRCNHTCRIHVTSARILDASNCLSTTHENKLRKLYDLFDVLSRRSELVNELQSSVGGDLITLMPFVLERIEAIHLSLPTSSLFSSPMTIFFGLLRGMPELLEN